MTKLEAKKERYLRDPIPIRLGGLAANLARVKSFSTNPANGDAVYGLFDESKYFIEWLAAETDIDTASALAGFQLQIALWQLNWNQRWDDENTRAEMARASAEWSQKILERSGLLG